MFNFDSFILYILQSQIVIYLLKIYYSVYKLQNFTGCLLTVENKVIKLNYHKYPKHLNLIFMGCSHLLHQDDDHKYVVGLPEYISHDSTVVVYSGEDIYTFEPGIPDWNMFFKDFENCIYHDDLD